MRRVSLNARIAWERDHADEVAVVLIRINHGSLAAPVRLSTDPSERTSIEPLAYGTRSTWLSGGPGKALYDFVLLEAVLPGEQDGAPASATLMLENHDNDVVAALRSVADQARADIAVVLASSPDLVEYEVLDLRLTTAEGDTGTTQLTLTRDPLASEPCPAGRMSKTRFPGLFA